MKRYRSLSVIMLIVIMLLGMSISAQADISIDESDISLSGENPFEYAASPDGVYPFIYHGTAPFYNMDIDTSECMEGRLYVYNENNGTVTEISPYTVTTYTPTKNELYFVTESQMLYRTDYSAASQQAIYQCEQGNISGLSSYLDILYFVENGSDVILLDLNTSTGTTVLHCEAIDWMILISATEMVVATINEEYFTYDYSTKDTTILESGLAATNMITSAVLSAAGTNSTGASIMATYTSSSVTQQNDISFPLDAYPATIYDSSEYSGFNHPTPISWFHYDGKEGCSISNCKKYTSTGECEGFARYAHDAYLHILDSTVAYSDWMSGHKSATLSMSDQSVFKSFFSSMNTGAYIRYGKASDPSPGDGAHSIVFVSADNLGIWVYECNQSYVSDDPENIYGCGVHFQYYTYVQLARNYNSINHCVNHSFAGTKTLFSLTYHNVSCTICNGFVRQSHTGTTAYSKYSSSKHKVTKTCCDGYTLSSHVYSNGVCKYCNYNQNTALDSLDPVVFTSSSESANAISQ